MTQHPDLKVLKFAVRRLVKASVQHSWRGSAEANSFADIDKEFEVAKSAYRRALRLLEQKLNKEQS